MYDKLNTDKYILQWMGIFVVFSVNQLSLLVEQDYQIALEMHKFARYKHMHANYIIGTYIVSNL